MWSLKVEKQTAHLRSHFFVTSMTPITVSETWLLQVLQVRGQPSVLEVFDSSKYLKKS
jgi:hypothetical protein